ncbi:class F sortase [Nocardioidaceae bacterium]|nr:class F sortase [Nocardioidaceae bacterium]
MTVYGTTAAAHDVWSDGTRDSAPPGLATPATPASPTSSSDAVAAASPSPAQGDASRIGRRTPVGEAAPPTGITVPALGMKARVVPVEVSPDGVLDPPSDVSLVGWWQRSAPLGVESGQTVLTGHSVHDGGGVMDDLEQLETGDRVRVFSEGALARYRVADVEVWSKAELAERALEIFGQDRDPDRLVLVTCEDWNGSDWESNVVVTADPV